MLTRKTVVVLTLLLAVPGISAAQVDARMFRQPAVSQTQIAFVYAGDIWIVSRKGGTATRLSSPQGEESFPRFSPDGRGSRTAPLTTATPTSTSSTRMAASRCASPITRWPIG
jgi:hypothetical protein